MIRRAARPRRARFAFVPPLLLPLIGCAVAPAPPPAPTAPGDHLALAPADYAALDGWAEEDFKDAAAALAKSCAVIVELPADRPVGRDGVGGEAGDWLGPCGALRELDAADAKSVRAYFETWFRPFRAGAPGGKSLFTGYYEAEVHGSLAPEGKYRVPVYARPDDLVALDLGPFESDLAGKRIWGRIEGGRLVPYWTRAEIEKGALGAHAKPLLWLDDAVDAHILSIQGSGRAILPDGGTMRIGFDGTNGRAFLGLSRILIDAGKIPATAATMPEVRDWLRAHPAEAAALMDRNPRYTFYRIVTGDGPIGAEGVALTPLRSLAVDPHFVPLGVPLWLETHAPDGRALRRLMIAQDAGAAIKGPVRGDVFWGAGETAFQEAGRMSSPGTMYLLLPRRRSAQVARAAE